MLTFLSSTWNWVEAAVNRHVYSKIADKFEEQIAIQMR